MTYIVEFEGKLIEAEDQNALILKLRKEYRLTQAAIGEAIGVTRSAIQQRLKRLGYSGPLEFPELNDPATFEGKTDEQIASEFRVPTYKVTTARHKLFPGERKKYTISVVTRRNRLCFKLFGDEYKPGGNFIDFIMNLSETLTGDRKAELIRDFYVKGAHEASADRINYDSRRVYRKTAVDELIKKVKIYPIEELLKKEVICKR